jgi:hypothetical protein
MRFKNNKGFAPEIIAGYKARILAAENDFLFAEDDESTDEYAHFYFIGNFEGREVVYDAVICTLRLQHESDLFELAEHRAAMHFPKYKKIMYREDENGNLLPLDELEEEIGLFMAEIIMELEEEDQVKVKEFADVDPKVEFGIGLDAGLNVEKITPGLIRRFIRDFNDGTLVLDDTLYSFQTEEEEAGN